MTEMQRTLAEVQSAASGLENAVESLEAISQHPQTPYPKHDIEQRANMARNTMRKQLDRSIQSQKEYEEKNAEKLQAARHKREEEFRKREEAKQAAEAAERERKQKIAEERQKISEKDRELAEMRAEEDRAREAAELTTDSETGDKVKRKKKPRGGGAGKRKKKNDDGVTDEDDSGVEPKARRRAKRGSGDDSDEEKPKKKRRLAKKAQEKPNKFKSSEIVVDSDSDGDNGAAEATQEMGRDAIEGTEPADMDIDEEEEPTVAPVKRKSRRAMIDSDDEDEEDAPAASGARDESPGTANGDTPMGDNVPAPEDSDDE